MDPKAVLASKTIQGLLAALLGLILPKLSLPIPVDAQKLAADIVSIVGIVWAIYGRASVPGQALRLGKLVISTALPLLKLNVEPMDVTASRQSYDTIGSGKPGTEGGFARLGPLGLLAALGLLALLLFSLPGCAKTSASATAYQPPAACQGAIVSGQYNATDSLILSATSDPTQINMLLQLANVAAIKSSAYTASQALKAINDIEAALDSVATCGDLAVYVTSRLGDANIAAGVVILRQTGLLAMYSAAAPLSACDIALIRAHLANQRALVTSFAATE